MECPRGAQRGDLEGSLNTLTEALSISLVQVASVVRLLIPQASLTNITSKAEESGSSEAVRILIEDTMLSDRKMRTGMMNEDDGSAF